MAKSIPNLTAWNPNKTNDDMERWICIYPAYINSKKTRSEGRRIQKEYCVENPTYMEIRDVLWEVGMQTCLENKLYCRERSKEITFRGRVRVHLKNNDGTLCNSNFPTRDSLLIYVGQKIPQLKTRQNKGSEASHSQQSSGAAGGHKKGKGKRR